MSWRRILTVLILISVPLLVLLVLGSWFLWHSGYGFYVWWPLTGCVGVGYFLAWYWLRQKQLIRPVQAAPPMHWTERDREAWQLVEKRAEQVAEQEVSKLNELQFYVNLAQELALDLARFYHPEAEDYFGSLTVPEILAVVELASHDLAELVDRNVPGSHVMTVSNWRWAQKTAEQATTWYRRASNALWLASAVLAPVETAARYAASRAGTGKPLQMFQQDLVAWFHTAFVHQLGTYLIDLNSGRLRVGARRYRELKTEAQGEQPAAAMVVTFTVLGQVKAGKSSLINALLGEQKARTDVLPATDAVERFQLKLEGTDNHLLLLDTPGYGHAGPKEDHLRATQEAARQSDLLLLVLHARNPGRQADLDLLHRLQEWFGQHPDLKMPPVLAVVTHIDLLSPAMERAPPYNWQEPQRPKELQIHEALTAVEEQLGDHLAGVVPVCTAEGKVHGVEEWLLPMLVGQLGEAKAVGLLRFLRAEVDANKVGKVLHQLVEAGGRAAMLWSELRHKRRP